MQQAQRKSPFQTIFFFLGIASTIIHSQQCHRGNSHIWNKAYDDNSLDRKHKYNLQLNPSKQRNPSAH